MNQLVLRAVREMPSGGGYSTSKVTDGIRQSAVGVREKNLWIQPEKAKPSYCSGATYLVFLKVLKQLQDSRQVAMNQRTLQRLAIADAKDGVEPWGRWNANGPGTAQFFKDTGLGINFTDLEKARPGDFLKIFWTKEIGKRERGHSVVYLGRSAAGIRFWSSNEEVGYGIKTVPLSRCKHLLFSRFTHPQAINAVAKLPLKDNYLASMLTMDYAARDVFRRVTR